MAIYFDCNIFRKICIWNSKNSNTSTLEKTFTIAQKTDVSTDYSSEKLDSNTSDELYHFGSVHDMQDSFKSQMKTFTNYFSHQPDKYQHNYATLSNIKDTNRNSLQNDYEITFTPLCGCFGFIRNSNSAKRPSLHLKNSQIAESKLHDQIKIFNFLKIQNDKKNSKFCSSSCLPLSNCSSLFPSTSSKKFKFYSNSLKKLKKKDNTYLSISPVSDTKYYSFESDISEELTNNTNLKDISSEQNGLICETCKQNSHVEFNPKLPLITSPGVLPDSYEERLIIAQSLLGDWITILDRSDSLDTHYRQIGLGMVKRAVMNRLAIVLTLFFESGDSILHCWIHTPLGIRIMKSDLTGNECIDDDPDVGKWSGTCCVVDYPIPWFCNGKTVRALQQIRKNPKIGTAVETRCVLPDKSEGKILLFNFVMYPKEKPDECWKANRILKVYTE